MTLFLPRCLVYLSMLPFILQNSVCILIITSLAKEVMFLVALVCLFVCLSVDNISQKVMNGLG